MEDYVRGYKYRIYPTKEQEAKFNQMFGNARVVFNYFLDVRHATSFSLETEQGFRLKIAGNRVLCSKMLETVQFMEKK